MQLFHGKSIWVKFGGVKHQIPGKVEIKIDPQKIEIDPINLRFWWGIQTDWVVNQPSQIRMLSLGNWFVNLIAHDLRTFDSIRG